MKSSKGRLRTSTKLNQSALDTSSIAHKTFDSATDAYSLEYKRRKSTITQKAALIMG